ncbi:14544_t:CDS:2 [Cetraspora pellucida]|uniref:14544_t:CDS:1 n=1 Tax=Cetraspora pellucida TaxID=1433469 RepID=A0ACA9KPE8_9GLOM|nr:14544_t:CDS:2 [Cetraspora pellucida]
MSDGLGKCQSGDLWDGLGKPPSDTYWGMGQAQTQARQIFLGPSSARKKKSPQQWAGPGSPKIRSGPSTKLFYRMSD